MESTGTLPLPRSLLFCLAGARHYINPNLAVYSEMDTHKRSVWSHNTWSTQRWAVLSVITDIHTDDKEPNIRKRSTSVEQVFATAQMKGRVVSKLTTPTIILIFHGSQKVHTNAPLKLQILRSGQSKTAAKNSWKTPPKNATSAHVTPIHGV